MKQYLSALSILVVTLFSATHMQAQIVISTFAGMGDAVGYSGDGGPAIYALLYNPSDIVLDGAGNLYIADFYNNAIRKIDTGGIIYTVAGTGFGSGTMAGGGYTGDGGPATSAELNGPFGITIDPSGNIYFADGYNHVVRKVSAAGIITTIAGNHIAAYTGDGGAATAAALDNPVGVALDKQGNLYIADDHNNAIRKVDTAGIITTFAGNHTSGYSGDGGPATVAALYDPIGVAVDTAGNVYVTDSNAIRMINTAGIITTFAGSDSGGYSGDGGPATAALLRSPERVNIDDSNNVYISDFDNNVIRKVTPSGIITTIAGDGTGAGSPPSGAYGGDGGPATDAQLAIPDGVAIDHSGNIYICDRGNDVIRLIAPVDHTGVSPLHTKTGNLTVYPNPAQSGYFNVNLASATTEPVQITVVNVLGETVKTISGVTNKQVAIQLECPAGIYFLSAVTGNGQWNKQIAVQ